MTCPQREFVRLIKCVRRAFRDASCDGPLPAQPEAGLVAFDALSYFALKFALRFST